MAMKLGLTLYSLGHRREAGKDQPRPPRPDGRLVWAHAPSALAARGALQLAHRLVDDDGLRVLLTCPDELPDHPGLTLQPPPPDTPAEARSFLDHWRPEIGLFCEGELRPALITEAASRRIPLLLADARKPHLPRDREGWFPGLIRGALQSFSRIGALDEAAARDFRRAGAPAEAVAVTGRLEEPSTVLPCNEAERTALAKHFATRPIWFAASLPEAEEESVLSAHRSVLLQAHRLLLIILPETPARAEAIAARAAEQGWAVARRSEDQEPEAETEVFLVDSPAEIGLWYRLAPISFLGGSLSGTGALRDPMEAAALGSAILHGPRTGPHGAAFGRLGAARAARAVASARDLADAVGDLLSPDRAARLAHAAWGVASEGAEATEALLAQIRRLMDGSG
jgi:3-deoxy-D-manno-octulosonic-acid transferase